MSILWWNTVGIVPSWYHRCYSCSVNVDDQWRLFLVFILDERRSYWHKKNVKAGLNCYLKRTTYFTGNSTCVGEGGGLKMKYLTFDNTLSWTIWFILICSTYFKYYTGRYTFYETIVPPQWYSPLHFMLRILCLSCIRYYSTCFCKLLAFAIIIVVIIIITRGLWLIARFLFISRFYVA